MVTRTLLDCHRKELIESGLNDVSILDTKIFTVTSKIDAKKLTGYPLEGMILPYIDPMGKPYVTDAGMPFYRIKPLWAPIEDLDEKPKYLSPKGEGNKPYFAPTFHQWDKALRVTKIPIHITEGEKKAALLGSLGYAAIGLTGIHGWKDKKIRTEEIEEIPAQCLEDDEDRDKSLNMLDDSRPLPELDSVNGVNIWKHRKVYITFDSDIIHKWQVKDALLQLAIWLKSKGAETYIVILPTEIDGSKNGVDDFIVRHGKDAYEALLKVAEPALTYSKGKTLLNLSVDPDLSQKSILLWSVLKEHWRYRAGIGWHNWTGTHWQLKDDGVGTFIDRDIYRFMRSNKWKHQECGAVGNLLRIMRADLLVENWNPKHKIAFQNGILDFKNEQFISELNREDFITVLLPYSYDPSADCPIWKDFINTALKGDREAIELVRAFFKWSLMPKLDGHRQGVPQLHVCWDLYGRPGTGKSTVLEMLRGIVGDHNCGTFSTQTFKDGNALAALLDKRVSICADDSGHMDDVGLFNRAISNETIEVKYLYKNIISTRLNTFFVRAYNDFPTTPSNAQGLNRRIVAMTFDHRPDQPDLNLGEKLERELAGIFNWAWGLSLPEITSIISNAGSVKSVADASEARFIANNPVFSFLQENYPDGGEVKIRDLLHEYNESCKDNGRRPISERLFSESIKGFGCYQKSKIKGFCRYSIPEMKNFDVIHFLGINRGSKDVSVLKLDENIQNGQNPPLQIPPKSLPILNNPPHILQSEALTDKDSDLRGDLQGVIPQNFYSNDTHTDLYITDIPNTSKCNTSAELLNEEVDATNLVTQKSGFVEHEISFRTLKLAKAWDKFIAVKFACYSVINKYARQLVHLPKQEGYIYHLYFRHASEPLMEFLKSVDLTKLP
jgi:putative DNA primase/helicase